MGGCSGFWKAISKSKARHYYGDGGEHWLVTDHKETNMAIVDMSTILRSSKRSLVKSFNICLLLQIWYHASELTQAQQEQVYAVFPGRQKVVIAETSVTIHVPRCFKALV